MGAGIAVRDKFEFGSLTLSEFDFRSLQALLARTFGTQAVYFRNGFQARDAGAAPEWCFRVRWVPIKDDPFAGRIEAVLVARKRDLEPFGAKIEDLFYAEGSPLTPQRRPVKRGPADERDLGHEFFRSLRRDDFELALSSSGADKREAQAMYDALTAAGFKVNWYRDPACRSGERERVLTFMNSLSRQPCIVLLVSAGFLRNDPVENWYCVWELADAIRQMGRQERTAAQTLVVFLEGADFKFAQFNEVTHKVLRDMAGHFHKAYGAVDPADAESFDYYETFSKHFHAAAKAENWTAFAKARGAHGSAISYVGLPAAANGAKDFGALIREVEKAVGRSATMSWR